MSLRPPFIRVEAFRLFFQIITNRMIQVQRKEILHFNRLGYSADNDLQAQQDARQGDRALTDVVLLIAPVCLACCLGSDLPGSGLVSFILLS